MRDTLPAAGLHYLACFTAQPHSCCACRLRRPGGSCPPPPASSGTAAPHSVPPAWAPSSLLLLPPRWPFAELEMPMGVPGCSMPPDAACPVGQGGVGRLWMGGRPACHPQCHHPTAHITMLPTAHITMQRMPGSTSTYTLTCRHGCQLQAASSKLTRHLRRHRGGVRHGQGAALSLGICGRRRHQGQVGRPGASRSEARTSTQECIRSQGAADAERRQPGRCRSKQAPPSQPGRCRHTTLPHQCWGARGTRTKASKDGHPLLEQLQVVVHHPGVVRVD